MNGEELLQAMSYVDEKYIDDAHHASARKRIRWQPIAAMAACLGLVLTAWNVQRMSVRKSLYSVQMSKAEAPMAMDFEAEESNFMLRSAVAEITVRVTAVEDGRFVCTVTDPGSGVYSVGTQLRVAPPETDSEIQPDMATGDFLLRVVFFPTADPEELIQAIEITPADES